MTSLITSSTLFLFIYSWFDHWLIPGTNNFTTLQSYSFCNYSPMKWFAATITQLMNTEALLRPPMIVYRCHYLRYKIGAHFFHSIRRKEVIWLCGVLRVRAILKLALRSAAAYVHDNMCIYVGSPRPRTSRPHACTCSLHHAGTYEVTALSGQSKPLWASHVHPVGLHYYAGIVGSAEELKYRETQSGKTEFVWH